MRDVKEMIGILMRALDDGVITEADVSDLDFDAEGELLVALNEAFVDLMQFARDRNLRRNDPELDARQRALLQASLGKIVALCTRNPEPAAD